MFDVANHGIFKFPGVRFKAIPYVQRYCVRIFFQQSFPLCWAQLIVLIWRDDAGIQSHDFRAKLDDQPWKGPGISSADLDVDVAKARVCLEEVNVSVHALGRAGQRSVDSLRSDQNPAFQSERRAKLPLFRGKGIGVLDQNYYKRG